VRSRRLPGGRIGERIGPLGLGWANLVTVLRILLIPVVVLLILEGSEGTGLAAATVFFVAAATDGLDGYLARRYDATTRTGQWLDPFADKLLISAPVVTLTALGRFPLWAAAIIVGRELAVSVLRAWLGMRGRSMPASPWGKAKTAAQILAIFLYIVPLANAGGPRLLALWLAVVLTVWSGLDYALRLQHRAPNG
ncbi:MAG TPA: CDP-diacylglycerol--glycerol-3-phosphate 3-phosphatidyltransferase, partial [Actinomycetota bacterium]